MGKNIICLSFPKGGVQSEAQEGINESGVSDVSGVEYGKVVQKSRSE